LSLVPNSPSGRVVDWNQRRPFDLLTQPKPRQAIAAER
jgi:hypothetical protein